MKTRNQPTAQKIYGVFHPDNGAVQFSYNATDDADATRKMNSWNRYHSFTGRGAFTCKELDPQSNEATWIRNEWMQ